MMTQQIKNNAFLYSLQAPDFSSMDDKVVFETTQALLEEAKERFSKFEALALSLSPEDLVSELEILSNDLDYFWGIVNHLNAVRTTEVLREGIEKSQPAIIRFSATMNQSKKLFEAYEKAAAQKTEDPALKRTLSLALRGMKHSGIGLPPEEQKRFNSIVERLGELSLGFSNTLLDATKRWSKVISDKSLLSGLPPSFLELLAQAATEAGLTQDNGEKPNAENGPWRLGLDAPTVVNFLKYADNRSLREELYRAYIRRAGPEDEKGLDNSERILEILALRDEQAKLLGFENYAELSIDAKMAPSVKKAKGLLEDLYEPSQKAALKEHEALQAFALANGGPDELALWDMAYWAEKQRQSLFSFSEEETRPYFPLPSVLDGLFSLVRDLFEVDISENKAVKGWHKDVMYFDVKALDGSPMAGFYLDPYSRPENKRGGAWMNELWGRSLALGKEGKPRLPKAYLVLNQSPPIGDEPSLMTWNEVSTLFHELGHSLQHMLTKVDILAVSGINGVEWDAVELPSQFMENFLRHRQFLKSFARHYKTQEPIPDALVDALLAAATFRAGTASLRQLYFGQMDLLLHESEPPKTSSELWERARAIAKTHTILHPLPEDRFLCSFGHIFAGGYAAGYYSYKWAEVLSADAFSAFEEAGLDDKEAQKACGKRFRDSVLALGGSVPPMEVFVRFRGREPKVDALLRHQNLDQS